MNISNGTENDSSNNKENRRSNCRWSLTIKRINMRILNFFGENGANDDFGGNFKKIDFFLTRIMSQYKWSLIVKWLKSTTKWIAAQLPLSRLMSQYRWSLTINSLTKTPLTPYSRVAGRVALTQLKILKMELQLRILNIQQKQKTLMVLKVQ